MSYSQPGFQGFWVEKLKDSEKQYYKMLNGRRYIVTELSTAIFPTTSGKLTIDPATLQLVVMTTPFGFSLFDRGVEKILRTQAVTVDVSALPAAGKPVIFDGAVGRGPPALRARSIVPRSRRAAVVPLFEAELTPLPRGLGDAGFAKVITEVRVDAARIARSNRTALDPPPGGSLIKVRG